MENRPLASLQTELDRATAQMEQNLPADMVKMFEQSVQQVKASAGAAGLKAGAQAPDFSLTDQNGASMTLSELTSFFCFIAASGARFAILRCGLINKRQNFLRRQERNLWRSVRKRRPIQPA